MKEGHLLGKRDDLLWRVLRSGQLSPSCLVDYAPLRALLVSLHQMMEVVVGGIMLGRAREGSLLLCCFDGGFRLLFSHRGFLPRVNSEPNLR